MENSKNPNLAILDLAVDRLGELADEMVFVGGCATGLLITDPAAPPIRMTQDVDAIVQVSSRADYYRLSERLRSRGFAEDTRDGAPLCRWVHEGVILDVMPTRGDILGFGNRWYEQAVKHAHQVEIAPGRSIRLVSAPYFLMTKLEAFAGRGRGDYLASHDMEDVIAVLDGRLGIAEETRLADPELRSELSKRFNALLSDDGFVDAVPGHLPYASTGAARAALVLEVMKTMAEWERNTAEADRTSM